MHTPMKPNPIPSDNQWTLTLYCLAHGCSLSSLEDVFGLSISTNDQTLNDVCRMLVQRLYDRYIKLQNTEEERRSKLALEMGFMYIRALNWKAILVLKGDIAYQI